MYIFWGKYFLFLQDEKKYYTYTFCKILRKNLFFDFSQQPERDRASYYQKTLIKIMRSDIAACAPLILYIVYIYYDSIKSAKIKN